MKCPKCGEDSNLVHRTDDSSYLPHIRRARLCRNCHFVFETVEQATGDRYFKRKEAALGPGLFDEVIERTQIHADELRAKRAVELDRRRTDV